MTAVDVAASAMDEKNRPSTTGVAESFVKKSIVVNSKQVEVTRKDWGKSELFNI